MGLIRHEIKAGVFFSQTSQNHYFRKYYLVLAFIKSSIEVATTWIKDENRFTCDLHLLIEGHGSRVLYYRIERKKKVNLNRFCWSSYRKQINNIPAQ